MNLRKIQEVGIKGKTVFLRADLDVPIQDGKIADDSRLNAWYETLEYLLKQDAKVIIAGHLGRPEPISNLKSQTSNDYKKFSLEPVARWIVQKLGIQSSEFRIENKDGFNGWRLSESVFLLENLRFFKEEEESSSTAPSRGGQAGQVFAQKLASLAQVYVNDAFASSHRAHASILGITRYIPSFAGLHLQKEVEELSKVLDNPKRPLAVIIGGAKIETKLPLVEKMHHFADYVLVGGEIAENDKILLKLQHEKLEKKKSVLIIADLIENKLDITEKSAESFVQIAGSCQTIVWNGPMGFTEKKEYQKGSLILAKGLSEFNVYKIAGGGDTLDFLKQTNLIGSFSFASIGGGAMLEFLTGEVLPGLIPLGAR